MAGRNASSPVGVTEPSEAHALPPSLSHTLPGLQGDPVGTLPASIHSFIQQKLTESLGRAESKIPSLPELPPYVGASALCCDTCPQSTPSPARGNRADSRTWPLGSSHLPACTIVVKWRTRPLPQFPPCKVGMITVTCPQDHHED